MKLASMTARQPHLLRALHTLALRPGHTEVADGLLQDLAGMTVLVAGKFTNDRTADGLLEASYLTLGCVSLGISLAEIHHDRESELSFLLHHGAEQVFQMGFRHIRELAGLPCQAMTSDFDKDPYIQQRNIKSLFSELCRADPNESWHGDEIFMKDRAIRLENKNMIDCAKWLRKNHFSGPVIEADLDASAVISIAVMFSILPDSYIVARTGQKEIENLIRRTRKTIPDFQANWTAFLNRVPLEYQRILQTRMDEYKNTLIRKILSKTSIKTLVTEIQSYHAGLEQDVEYD